jgi:Transcriptional regulators
MKNVQKLLEKNPNLDGIICATDTIAIGAMSYLREKNMKIPEELIIAGFGGSKLSSVPTPTLTTVNFDYEESGRIAATVILNTQSKNEKIRKSIMLGYEIIENQSTDM